MLRIFMSWSVFLSRLFFFHVSVSFCRFVFFSHLSSFASYFYLLCLCQVKIGRVLFTYDVMWRASNVKWASRWDIYLSMDNAVPDKVWGIGYGEVCDIYLSMDNAVPEKVWGGI